MIDYDEEGVKGIGRLGGGGFTLMGYFRRFEILLIYLLPFCENIVLGVVHEMLYEIRDIVDILALFT